MPISPAEVEAYAQTIYRIYADAERIMLAKVARRLARGIEQEGWAERKLAEIQAVRRDISQGLTELQKVNQEIEQAIVDSYEKGAEAAVKDLEKANKPVKSRAASELNKQSVKVIAQTAVSTLAATHFRILRTTEDIYRSVIAETASQVLAGTVTRREAAQMALNRFADVGVSGFIDRAGRRWDMASYAEMAIRSACGQAAVEGHLDKLLDNDHDLVIVSGGFESCPLCVPWEGRVLSISGQTPGYPTVADARANGLWHPNCVHTVGIYLHGYTKPMLSEAKTQPGAYEERQQQRYNERMIRKWKRREATAITEQERAFARAKAREWQARQREFIAQTGRRRKYERESITSAR